MLACAHGGKPRVLESKIRHTSTRLLECPWSAVIRRLPKSDKWKIEITNDEHNHRPSKDFSEIPASRLMTQAEQTKVVDMANNGAPPRIILRTLKASDTNNTSTSQDIYNIVKQARQDELNGRTPIEALLDNLKGQDVFHTYELDSNHKITRFFVAPNACILATRNFWTNNMILMDATYKTNRCVFFSFFPYQIF